MKGEGQGWRLGETPETSQKFRYRTGRRGDAVRFESSLARRGLILMGHRGLTRPG